MHSRTPQTPPHHPARRLDVLLAAVARTLRAGGSTNDALAATGLTKHKVAPQRFEIRLDGHTVFAGDSWAVTCWLGGLDPETGLELETARGAA